MSRSPLQKTGNTTKIPEYCAREARTENTGNRRQGTRYLLVNGRVRSLALVFDLLASVLYLLSHLLGRALGAVHGLFGQFFGLLGRVVDLVLNLAFRICHESSPDRETDWLATTR